MAEHDLHDEFLTTHQRVSLRDRALIAIAAHVEVRSVLRADPHLQAHGLDDILIGSYARRVSIWPGKDVDVFGRLQSETVGSMTPDAAYGMFGEALSPFEAQRRLTPQPRSFKVDFSPERLPGDQFIRTAAQEYGWTAKRVGRILSELEQLAFEFSVDVVPAVKWNAHYGIPEVGRIRSTGERYRTGRWRLTDPVELTRLTQDRNKAPLIRGVGAYMRSVKQLKHIKAHHLADTKPSDLFYEFVLYEGFSVGAISGGSWADITSSALTFIAQRLREVDDQPVQDPVLNEEYQPTLSASDLVAVQSVFNDLAQRARRAVTASTQCQASIEWRHIFGGNERYDNVFPLPPGCRGTGVTMGVAAANVAAGGTAERSFGDR